MRPIISRVAARIREERQRQGSSLETTALAANVSRTSLARFEKGKSSLQLETLVRIVVHGLGLDWAEFMASTAESQASRQGEQRPPVLLNAAEVTLMRALLVTALRVFRGAQRRANSSEKHHT